MSRDDQLHETEAFSMSPRTCPVCSVPVYDELPGGLCPACLMDAARKSNPGYDQTQARSGVRIEPPSIEELASLFPELEILKLIGTGGMGAVYKAKQKNLDRLVALKIFLFEKTDARISQRFNQEARALAKFNHQNIVTIHDTGCRGNFHFLLMEFVDGPNLRQVVCAGELTPANALSLVPQLCDALQYAHEKGIVHRDIKPENVLLLPDGIVKIADFGLAKITDQATELNLTNTQQVMGTFNYMAPEQRERPGEVDHRADIYSLGVVIYELLTGELPMGRFDPPSKRVQVDQRFDEVVMRALEKEPDRRYQRVTEFKTSMESVAHLAPKRINPVPPIKSKVISQDSQTPGKGKFKVTTIPQMLFFAFAMFVCCAGVVCLIMSAEDFFPEEMNQVGGRFLGLMVIMAGGFLFASQSFVSQIFSFSSTIGTRLLGALGVLAMFTGFAGASLFIASEHTHILHPTRANAETNKEQEERIALLQKKWAENPQPAMKADRLIYTPPTVEDFQAQRNKLQKIFRACGVGACMLCGFLFAVYGTACSMLEKNDED